MAQAKGFGTQDTAGYLKMLTVSMIASFTTSTFNSFKIPRQGLIHEGKNVKKDQGIWQWKYKSLCFVKRWPRASVKEEQSLETLDKKALKFNSSSVIFGEEIFWRPRQNIFDLLVVTLLWEGFIVTYGGGRLELRLIRVFQKKPESYIHP